MEESYFDFGCSCVVLAFSHNKGDCHWCYLSNADIHSKLAIQAYFSAPNAQPYSQVAGP